MLYEYELENFKAFASSGPLPIRPITLLYGPNSSGKSSLLQSMLLLKQTLDESETPETLLLPKGNLVDLGGYREFVHCHEPERPFSIRFTQAFDPQANAAGMLFGELGQKLQLKQVGLRITFGYDESAANAIAQEFSFYINDMSSPLCTFERGKMTADELERFTSARLRPRRSTQFQLFRGAKINSSHPFLRSIAMAEQEFSSFRSKDRLQETIRMLKRELLNAEKTSKKRSRNSISKERLQEQLRGYEEELRLYERPAEEVVPELVRRHLQTFFSARNFLPGEFETLPEITEEKLSSLERRHLLLNFGGEAGLTGSIYTQIGQLFRLFLDTLVYLGPLRESPGRQYVFSGNVTGQVGKTGRLVPDVLFKNRALLDSVNEQLTAFGIGYKLLIAGAAPGAELSDVFSLRLVDKQTNVTASILDVGFGISQVLPVIVQSMLSRNKILCIEQPEIHLHPRLQAELGSLLATCIKPPYNNCFIAETHSKHLVLRIQKLISQGVLTPDEVAVLYVDKGQKGSRCLELRLDSQGDFIDEWPHGFFEEGYTEMFSR